MTESPPNYRHSERFANRPHGCFTCKYMNQYFDKIVCMEYLVQINLFGVCDSWVEDGRDLTERHLRKSERELIEHREPLPICDLKDNKWPI